MKPDNHQMLFIPKGCAHGFQTLESDSKMIYFHSEFYSPKSANGLNYADPKLAITWPFSPVDISAADATRPFIDTNFKGIKL